MAVIAVTEAVLGEDGTCLPNPSDESDYVEVREVLDLLRIWH